MNGRRPLSLIVACWIGLAGLAGCLDGASRGTTAEADGATAPDADGAGDETSDVAGCAPGAMRCVGATAERCEADGSWGFAAACGAPERCVDGACAGPCAGPGLACADGAAVYCVAGEVAASADCARWGRVCVAGACRARACTPGARACDGDAIATCDATGSEQTRASCAAGAVCVADDAGPVCVPGSCVVGARSCVDGAAALCVAADAPLALTSCEAGRVCDAGECVPAGSCAVPSILVDGPTTRPPHAVVHLTVDRPDLTLGWYVVEEPPGAAVVFSPNAHQAAVSVALDVVGSYRFGVVAAGADGQTCADAEVALTVVPETAVHVELVWETPADPDPTDVGPDAGADLDLHVVSPIQADGPNGVALVDHLFDAPWDTSWLAPAPNGAPLDPAADDDPRLLHDDSDGTGPEVIAIGLPHVGADYLVAVHGWSDHGFGASRATLRVYVYGALAFEAEQTVAGLDLWPAAVVRWPSGDVLPVGACGGAADAPLCTGADTCDGVAACVPGVRSGYLPPGFVGH